MNDQNSSLQTQPNRPQTPQAPFSYTAQDVQFTNDAAGIMLAGTLTLPTAPGKHPVVILIAGMGPMDRDGTFNDHKPLLVIADHFTRNGIAVLRFDKRGIGQSTGTLDLNVTSQDLAGDVQAGIEYLKTRPEINPAQIGLAGESEGGFIASIVAAESHDIAFAILMAGAVFNSVEGVVAQVAIQLKADGASEAMIASDGALRTQVLQTVKTLNPAQAEPVLHKLWADYWAQLPHAQRDESAHLLFAFSQANAIGQLQRINSPWYRFLLTYDSAAALARIAVPLLAMYGERDFMAPHLMLPFIRTAMERAGNKDYTLLAMPNLNHSMQTCVTGAIAEYSTIEETIAPVALQTMADWIVQRTK